MNREREFDEKEIVWTDKGQRGDDGIILECQPPSDKYGANAKAGRVQTVRTMMQGMDWIWMWVKTIMVNLQ